MRFHTTGITCAISPQGAAEAVRSLKIAKECGLTTSFDLNFRSTLWSPAEVIKNPWAEEGAFVVLQGPLVPQEVGADDPRLWENMLFGK